MAAVTLPAPKQLVVRSLGVAGPVAAFLNSNDNNYGSEEIGVCSLYKYGPSDYRGMIEMIQNNGPLGPSITNVIGYVTSVNGLIWARGTVPLIIPSAGAPDNGEICVNSIVVNPATGYVYLFAHVGNNTGPRVTVVYRKNSLDGAGGWSRFLTFMSVDQTYEGSAGAAANQAASDCKIDRLGLNNWVGLYRAGLSAVATGGIARVTCGDDLVATKGGVVLAKGAAGQWDETYVSLFGRWWGDDGRLHVQYVGANATQERIGGAYSDNQAVSFTKLGINPVITASGGAAAFDKLIGREFHLTDDDCHLIGTLGCMNLTGYVANNPLRAQYQVFYPAPLTALPSGRSARCFWDAQRLVIPTAGVSLLNSNAWWAYFEYKAPPLGVPRQFLSDVNAFNAYFAIGLDTSGKLAFTGQSGATAISTAGRPAATDDNTWRPAMFVRRGLASWAIVDVLTNTDLWTAANSLALNAGATVRTIGNMDAGNATGAGDQPCLGSIRRVVYSSTAEPSAADKLALWNGGAGGVLPAACTSGNTRDWKPGSGGQAGPDLDQLAAASGTVTGAYLVKGESLTQQVVSFARPSGDGLNVRRRRSA